MLTDNDFMRLALAQAVQAAELGEVPVGAVVVRRGQVIATGRNAPIGAHDPTAHAEIMALRAAALALGNYRLDDCELYVTLEPCAMCSGAMLHARLKRVVFGAAQPKTGAAGSVVDLFANPQLNHQTALLGGVLSADCTALLQQFFQQRRLDARSAAESHLSDNTPLRDDTLRTPDAAFAPLPDYPWQARYLCDVDGLRMHYLYEQFELGESGGPGMALCATPTSSSTYLCLHSRPAWSYVYRHLIAALLNAGQVVVAPDLVGFGKSDKPKKTGFHTLSNQCRSLLTLLDHLETQPQHQPLKLVLVLCGNDSLGLSLLSARPDCFDGLLVLSAPGAESTQTSPMTLAAAKAPFPDAGHRAGVRASSVDWPAQQTAPNLPAGWAGQHLYFAAQAGPFKATAHLQNAWPNLHPAFCKEAVATALTLFKIC